MQTARARVTSRLVFHFKDGSLHEETATAAAAVSIAQDHLVQKGPSFPAADRHDDRR